MLVGRDEDLRVLAKYYRESKNTYKRNLINWKYRMLMVENKDRKLATLRQTLIEHERKGDMQLAEDTRSAIRLHQHRMKIAT
jgi:hypothetical protein